jgi:catechol 2,3-dioxygenase-like lactoylglutathione lyase family enzyme
MLDHIGLTVSDLKRSHVFYDHALAPLGISRMKDFSKDGTGATGYGDTDPFFWIASGEKPKGGVHVAFRVNSRALVDAFYQAAMAAGGRDNGPPGLRPQYHATYYGAFVFDPDGNNVEAVCHSPA